MKKKLRVTSSVATAFKGYSDDKLIGNVEGRDINKGTVDVVVCDGFVGNVVLKFGEGLAKAIMTLIKEAIMNGGIL